MRDDDGYEYSLLENTPRRLTRPTYHVGPRYDSAAVRDTRQDREEIDKQVQEFLKKGGEIKEVGYGESALDVSTGVAKCKLAELKKNWEKGAKAQKDYSGSGRKKNYG